MDQKLNYSASEPLTGISREVTILSKALPTVLKNELGKFVNRNAEHYNGRPCYCSRCLKAHLIKKAKALHIDSKTEQSILTVLKCEHGHNGYYLDGERLLHI